MKKLNIDRAFLQIGELGPIQIRYCLLLCLLNAFAPQIMLQYTYVGQSMEFQCVVNNQTILRNSCPSNEKSTCSSIEFDTKVKDSIESEWNLICEDASWSPSTMSIFMAGVMMGSLTLGSLSDFAGRKKTLILSLFMVLVLNALSAVISSFYWYLALKFALGFFKSGYILCSYVLLNELIGKTKRGLMGTLTQAFFAIGIVIFSLIAYKVRHWRSLTLTTSLMGIPLLLLSCLILPESPIWLNSKGKFQDTLTVLKDIASGNHSKWDQKLIQTDSSSSENEDEDSEDEITIQPHLPAQAKSSSQEADSVSSLFANKFLLMLTLIQIWSWFVNSCSYYGLNLVAGDFGGGDLYTGVALAGCVELPAYVLNILTLKHFGRRDNLAAYMISGGIAMLIIPLLATSVPFVITTLGLFGKLCISSSFNIIYIHSNEIFPTTIRNVSMGLVSSAARLGGILSPHLAKLGDVYPNLHFILFGLMGLTAGLLSLKLPETKGLPLSETVQDLRQRQFHIVSVQSPHVTYKKVSKSDQDL